MTGTKKLETGPERRAAEIHACQECVQALQRHNVIPLEMGLNDCVAEIRRWGVARVEQLSDAQVTELIMLLSTACSLASQIEAQNKVVDREANRLRAKARRAEARAQAKAQARAHAAVPIAETTAEETGGGGVALAS